MQNIFHIQCQNIDTVTLPAASYRHSTRSSPLLMVSRRCQGPASVNSYFAPVLLIGLRCPVSFILPVVVRPGRAFPKDRKYHGNLGKCPYPTHKREVWKNLQSNLWAFSLCILNKGDHPEDVSPGDSVTNHRMALTPGETETSGKWEFSSQSAFTQGSGEKYLRRKI